MIYVDTDGVLADFLPSTVNLTGIPMAELDIHASWPDALWLRIVKACPTLYRDLAPRYDAVKLVTCLQAAKKLKRDGLINLTGLPPTKHMPTATKDKTFWTNHHFPTVFDRVIVCARSEKQKYAKPGDLLIDDYSKNCDEWRKAGGEAIQYRGFESFIELFKPYVEEFL